MNFAQLKIKLLLFTLTVLNKRERKGPDINLVLKLNEILPLVQKEEINDVIGFTNFKLDEKAARFSTF
ncbi:hypothetical protein HZS_3481 [Henneguya salminicola]|nr:hypothetical protein HZS_3481 [Henneguya salminicola]